ncbi:DUF2769 domain-containing protein [Methanoregula sp.]|jgi:hypothetical protein|uniref:DUF2769 domain-containing protein n=1 Tax=Methanoregula sp. TaxID=2052170 RepID=UPI003C177BC8
MATSKSSTCVLPEDTFTKAMKSMVKMPADQAKAKVGELEKICVCSTCPTYTATCASKAGESVFCARGTSFKCITANKGCVCTTCPVSKSMGLEYQSFCLLDGEKSQRFDAMLR